MRHELLKLASYATALKTSALEACSLTAAVSP